jgi:hypothetical protein
VTFSEKSATGPDPEPDKSAFFQSISLGPTLILSSSLRLHLLKGSRFPSKALCAFLFAPVHATSPVSVNLIDLKIRVIFDAESEV